MKIEELKKEIEIENSKVQKLKDKLRKIEDKNYSKKIKKLIGNIYLKTYGRGKNKECIITKIIGRHKGRVKTKEISLYRDAFYFLGNTKDGKKISKLEVKKLIENFLEEKDENTKKANKSQ